MVMSNCGACLRICSTQATPAIPLPTTTSDRLGVLPGAGAVLTSDSNWCTEVAAASSACIGLAPGSSDCIEVAAGSLEPGDDRGRSRDRQVASITACTSGRH